MEARFETVKLKKASKTMGNAVVYLVEGTRLQA
jgi:hypothetical protein